MSEEEKKAIEYWKRDISFYHCNTQLASEYYAQIILNLIEKQQKELEQEKEKNNRLEKFIENGEYTWKQKYKETFDYVRDRFIDKDKIKEFIEENTRTGRGYNEYEEGLIDENDRIIDKLSKMIEEN